jgi:ABC-type nitrate/sulfonate/bicarbonate transport system substrate-binding protein
MPHSLDRRALLQLGLAAGATLPWTPPARGAAPIRMNIANTFSNSTVTLQTLLKQQGWLEKFGVDATTQNIADGSKLMGALISGASDICLLSGFGQVLSAQEKGAAIKIVAGAGLLPYQAMYAKKPEIRSLKDLEGRTIGTGSVGALLYQITVALLQKRNVDISKIRFVNVGSSADVFRAVAAGVVDAGPSLYDMYEQAGHYGVHTLTDGDFWTALPEYTYQASYASSQAIANKRDGVVRVLAAYCEMYRFISSPDSRDAYIKARQDGLGGDKDLDAQEALTEWHFIQKYQPYATNLVIDQARIDYMQKLNLEFGTQTRMLPYDQVTDMSLARDAVKLLD